LYQNIAEGKITQLESSAKTYLFGIAKHLLYQRMDTKKYATTPVDQYPEIPVDPVYLKQAEQDHQRLSLRAALDQLGPACSRLLQFFYYYNFSLEAIAHRMRYKNADTVKSQKHRCIKQLRILLEHQSEGL